MVAELVRVVRPGGVLVIHLGVYGGPWKRSDDARQMVGVPTEPVGIGWHREEELDAEVARHGGRLLLPHLAGRGEERLADLLDGVEQNHYSWTWPVPDDVRRAAVAELRPWAQERFGPLDQALGCTRRRSCGELRPPRPPATPGGLTGRYPYGSVRHSRRLAMKEAPRMPIAEVEKIWFDRELVDWREAKMHVLSHALITAPACSRGCVPTRRIGAPPFGTSRST